MKGLLVLMIALSLGAGTAWAQIQNPYWVVPKGPTFQAVKNAQSPGPVLYNLPGSSTVSAIRCASTAANGWFDACGNPLFFQVGDEVFTNLGSAIGVMNGKDQFIKSLGPSEWYKTENFEVPIVPAPATSNLNYFIFYTNASPNGTEVYMARYDLITKTLISKDVSIGNKNQGSAAVRLAVSKPTSNGSIIVYGVGNFTPNNVFKITIPISGANPTYTTLGTAATNAYVGAELELSHDQSKLAWSSGTTISTFNLNTNTHSTFTPFSGAFNLVSGLEWLPDGSLAAAIQWSSYSFFDGICILNPSLSAFTFLANSAAYKKAALELGYYNSNTPRFFAYNGSFLQGIQVVSGIPSFTGSTLPLTWNFLTSPFGTGFHPVLPDQNDGQYYVNINACSGGGGDTGTDSGPIPIPIESSLNSNFGQ